MILSSSNLVVYTVLVSISTSIIGCSSNPKEATPALFDTKVEAKKAAKDFNCKGAHKMGDKWMPCKSHEIHEKQQKKGSHGHHGHSH